MRDYPFAAIILPNFSDHFQREYWPGIHAAACERKVIPVYFLGSFPMIRDFYGDVGHYVEKSIIFKLANVPMFDGYLINQTLKLFMSKKEYDCHIKNFSKKPMISTASDFDQGYIATIDNYHGMADMVRHFVKVHNCKKPAFLIGSTKQTDSRERYQAYCDVLKENDIEIDQRYVFQGNYTKKSGMYAVREFINERKIKPDAIICANDEMAFGVLEELNNIGIKVPQEIKVGGFDNISECEFSFPPLTSVTQPFAKITYIAMNNLIDVMEKRTIDRVVKVKCPLVIRESCGCSIQLADRQLYFKEENDITVIFDNFRKGIREFTLIENMGLLLSQAAELLTIYFKNSNISMLITKSTEYLENILKQSMDDIGCVRVWSDILTFIAEIIETSPSKFENEPYKYLIAVEKCRRVLYEFLWRNFGLVGKEQLDVAWENVLSINQRLSSSFTLAELKSNLNQMLPALGIEHLYLVFYDQIYENINSINFEIPQNSKLLYGFAKNGEQPSEDIYFETKNILPLGCFDKFSTDSIITVQALHFQKEHYGYMVMNVSNNHYSFYTHESIVESVNTALKVNGIIDELQSTRNGLIRSAKMASLGNLLAGVAHEINNPMNFISTGIQAAEVIFKDLSKLINNNNEVEKIKSEFQGIDIQISELFENVKNGIERTNRIVKTLLNFSRDSGKNETLCNINDVIETAVMILYNKYEKTIDIEKNYSELPPTLVHSGRLTQLFINIIKNSFDALTEMKNNIDGKVKISTKNKEVKGIDSIVVKIHNNGPEIPEKVMKRIFDPYFTTKEVGKGIGLGLSISFSIAEEHYGSLTLENNNGVEYTLILPVRR